MGPKNNQSINQSINQSFICLNTDIAEKQHITNKQ